MPLSKRWRDLDRDAVGATPTRYGVVEFGTDGEVESIEVGVVRDTVKDAVAYGDHGQVRWQAAQNRDHAERLAADHRDRH